MFGGRRVRSRSQRRNRSTNVRRSKNVRRSRSRSGSRSRSRSRSRSGSTRRAIRTRRRQRGKGDPRWLGHDRGIVAKTGSSGALQYCYNLVKKEKECPPDANGKPDIWNLGNLQVYNKPTNTFEPATEEEKKLHCCAIKKK